jgi:hypothetical protein
VQDSEAEPDRLLPVGRPTLSGTMSIMGNLGTLATCLLLVRTLGAAVTERWPQFRGSDSLGVADDASLPDTWSLTENIAWNTDIPGTGWSSPVIWGDRIFLTSVISADKQETPKKGLYFGGNRLEPPRDEHRWMIYCLDWKTGKILWAREVHRGARNPRAT